MCAVLLIGGALGIGVAMRGCPDTGAVVETGELVEAGASGTTRMGIVSAVFSVIPCFVMGSFKMVP